MSGAQEPNLVLIAGCNGALGTALCASFLERGFRVFGCSRRAARMAHERFEQHQADLSSEEGVLDWLNAIDARGVSPGVLILNSAISSGGVLATVIEKDLLEVMQVNWLGPCLLIRECMKRMMARKFGRIVAMSSIRASEPVGGAGVYSMSKVAMEQLIRQTALEGGRFGITANAVAISILATGMAESLSDEARREIVRRCAIPRYCTADDVLNAVDFFVRPESSYVTGQILHLGFI